MSTELPSPRIALTLAFDEMRSPDGDPARADVWIRLAKELREGAKLPEQPTDRLTLHDVEGIVCAHGRVVVRRRDSTKRSEWWRHADSDPTVCDDVQQESEQDRRVPHGVVWVESGPGVRRIVPADELKRYAETGSFSDSSSAQTQVEERFWQDAHVAYSGAAPSTISPVIEMPDHIAGYERGQILPPTLAQLIYAGQLGDLLAAGRALPFGISESFRDLLRSLVDEILSRAQEQLAQTTSSDLDQTTVLATRVRVPPARPAAVPPADHGVCVHCGMDVYRIAETSLGEAVKYRHDYTDQQVCQGQRTQSGDETFVHTFAWPAPQG